MKRSDCGYESNRLINARPQRTNKRPVKIRFYFCFRRSFFTIDVFVIDVIPLYGTSMNIQYIDERIESINLISILCLLAARYHIRACVVDNMR